MRYEHVFNDLTSKKYLSFAPLHAFPWLDSGKILLGDHIWIQKTINRSPFNSILDLFKDELTINELAKEKVARTYICIEEDQKSSEQERAMVKLFLFALWIVKPTMTKHMHWFKVKDGIRSSCAGYSRIFDFYRPITNRGNQFVSNRQLKTVARIFKPIRQIYTNYGRLCNALLFNHFANTSCHLQMAFTMHVAALETIFILDEYRGFTRNLSARCACFLEKSKSRRDKLYRRVHQLYDIRSEIIHGKYFGDKGADAKKNIDALRSLSTVTRRCWLKLLSDPKVESALNSENKIRKQFFDKITDGYQIPK